MNSEKISDEVEWPRMFQVLKEAGVKFKERRIILNLYIDQLAEMRLGHEVDETDL